MLPLELSVIAALLLSAGAGVAVSTWVCRSMLFHRRPRLQLGYAGFYLLVAVSSALALSVGWELSGITTDLMLATQTAALGGLFPLLREFFAYALIDLEPGDEVRDAEMWGRVSDFGWTGVDLYLPDEGRTVSRRPTWLMDKILSHCSPK